MWPIINRAGQILRAGTPSQYFGNKDPAGNSILPTRDANGKPIKYQSHATSRSEPERVVTGSDGSQWYSPDHYDHFMRVQYYP
ncbi:MAG: hypothetical protein JOZ53_14900 [Planctomycetaceae bacterium]|nr:hypothetical protein [Planctomycetaceae bacterium]